MRIVIDTNVLISGVFFGGLPEKLLISIACGDHVALISPEIWEEYEEIIQRMTPKYGHRLRSDLLKKLFPRFEMHLVTQKADICRDPDDNKFLDLAVEGKCLYIVSGDNDLLSIGKYEDVEIVTAAEFFSRLNDIL